MATDEPTPPEGFGAFEPNRTDNDDDDQIELSPGETLSGLVLNATDGENEMGPWVRLKIKDEDRGVVVYFAKGDVKNAYYDGRIEEGEPIWIAKTAEEQSFVPEGEDEEVTFNPTKVAFPEE